MNTFNRILLILVCLTLLVVAVAIIVLTWTIPNRTIGWLADAVQWMDDNDGDREKALLTTVSAFVGLVATIVLLIQLIPRRGPAVRVTDLTLSAATLSTAAIGQRIEEAVCQVPNVADVRANVKSKRRGVLVDIDLHVEPEANLATVTDEACKVAQETLTERVHVTLLKPPKVRLHYRELRLQGRGHATNGTRRITVRPGARPTTSTESLVPELTPALSTAGSGSLALQEPLAQGDDASHLRAEDEADDSAIETESKGEGIEGDASAQHESEEKTT
jgi:hypothetical protein